MCRQINHSDYYELIAGERRLRAAILANLQSVPCIVVECEYEDSAVYSIIENIQRSDLNFFEEALAISHLMNTFGITQQQIRKSLEKVKVHCQISLGFCDSLPMSDILLTKRD